LTGLAAADANNDHTNMASYYSCDAFSLQPLSSTSLSTSRILPRESDCGDGGGDHHLGNGGFDAAGLANAGFNELAWLGSGSGSAGFGAARFDGDGWGDAFYDEGVGLDEAASGKLNLTIGWAEVSKLTAAKVQVLNTSILSIL